MIKVLSILIAFFIIGCQAMLDKNEITKNERAGIITDSNTIDVFVISRVISDDFPRIVNDSILQTIPKKDVISSELIASNVIYYDGNQTATIYLRYNETGKRELTHLAKANIGNTLVILVNNKVLWQHSITGEINNGIIDFTVDEVLLKSIIKE